MDLASVRQVFYSRSAQAVLCSFKMRGTRLDFDTSEMQYSQSYFDRITGYCESTVWCQHSKASDATFTPVS